MKYGVANAHLLHMHAFAALGTEISISLVLRKGGSPVREPHHFSAVPVVRSAFETHPPRRTRDSCYFCSFHRPEGFGEPSAGSVTPLVPDVSALGKAHE